MKLFLWCFTCFSLGFAAELPHHIYGLKGNSISLKINHRNWSQVNKTVWRRSNTVLLANKEGVSPYFVNKITLNVSDWSLTIHNLHENDSGLYKALDKWELMTITEYRLTVEDNVSKPVIKVKELNSSSGECLAKVNCSVDGNWAVYDCDKGDCKETQSSLSSININVSVEQSGIKCLAKNNVSSSHSGTTNFMCYEKQSRLASPTASTPWIIITVCGGGLLGLIVGLIALAVRKRKSSKIHPQVPPGNVQTPTTPTENNVTTIYDVPTRRPNAHRADSEEVMTQNQDEQQHGLPGTFKVRATVHKTEEADSGEISTVYCKLGEI